MGDKRKQARAFHRMLTGLQIAQNSMARMRFLTLTSVKYPRHELKDGFDVLKERIRRATYYWEKDGRGHRKGDVKDKFHGFKFNRYFCIRTSEGNGVLHIVYWGRYIPQEWIKEQWMEINGAFEIKIKEVMEEKRRVGGLVGYLITNYLTEQPIERMSYGWRWAWLGFCKSWKRVQEHYGLMRRFRIPKKVLRGENDNSGRKSAHEMWANNSWEAWWTFLHGDRITSVQKKLCGGRSLKWYVPELKVERLPKEPEPTADEKREAALRWFTPYDY